MHANTPQKTKGALPCSASEERCGQDKGRHCSMPRSRVKGKGYELEQGRNREKVFPQEWSSPKRGGDWSGTALPSRALQSGVREGGDGLFTLCASFSHPGAAPAVTDQRRLGTEGTGSRVQRRAATVWSVPTRGSGQTGTGLPSPRGASAKRQRTGAENGRSRAALRPCARLQA